MRQFTDEFRPNPFESIRTRAIADPDMTDNDEQIFKVWFRNKNVEMAHKWCVPQSNINLSSSKFSDAENQRLQNCLGKYHAAQLVFEEERNLFARRIQELEERGISRFANLNH